MSQKEKPSINKIKPTGTIINTHSLSPPLILYTLRLFYYNVEQANVRESGTFGEYTPV